MLLAALVLLNPLSLFFIWMILAGYSDVNPERGLGEASVGWLPAAASNISYYRTYSWSAYEFDIDEIGFLRWGERWQFREISEPVTIPRFSYWDYWVNPKIENLEKRERHRREHLAVVSEGWFHRMKYDDGGEIIVAYDRSVQRAYYKYSPR